MTHHVTKFLGLLVAAPLVAVAPAYAQQVVETSTDTTHNAYAGHQCGVSQAMLAAIENGEDTRKAETKARLNALLDSALASTRSRPQAAQSPVVFPPSRSGS